MTCKKSNTTPAPDAGTEGRISVGTILAYILTVVVTVILAAIAVEQNFYTGG